MELIQEQYRKILSHISEDSQEEVRELLEQKSLGTHEEKLCEVLTGPSLSPISLFEYGAQCVSATSSLPNPALSRFFFVLSALHSLPAQAFDWAMDAMVLCANDDGFPVPRDRNELIRAYKEVVHPLLDKQGV